MIILRLIVRLVLVVLPLQWLVVVLASQQHPIAPLEAPGFDACSLPCWAGIAPGASRTLDVPQIMAASIPDGQFAFHQIGAQINFNAVSPDRHLTGTIYDDRGTVGGIRMMSRLPLWRFMEMVGTPACVSQQQMNMDDERFVTVWWSREKRTISATLLLRPADWNASAEVISLAVFGQDAPCDSPVYKPWQGFAPLWFYAPNHAG